MNLQEEVKKHGSLKAAAKALKLPRTTLQYRLKKESPVKSIAGKSISEFRAAHDKSFIIPNKIKAALKSLGDGWEYELQFSKIAGVSLADLGSFRPMFEEYIVLVERTKRAWAGSKATAEKMRAMVR